jgi:hypothetical protein
MSNQATRALETIADLRAENRELKRRLERARIERDRYEKGLREIAGDNSGVWGRIADAHLRGEER